MLAKQARFISTAFLFCLCFSLFGQDALIMKNIRSGKIIRYEKKSRITYIRINEQDYSTGMLNALLDSSVVFKNDTVTLKDIAAIRKKSPLHYVARIAGMPLMFIGSLLMSQGAVVMYNNPDMDIGFDNFLLGAAFFTVGYLPYELDLEAFTVGIHGDWVLEIEKANGSAK